jgi:hypothetical protein
LAGFAPKCLLIEGFRAVSGGRTVVLAVNPWLGVSANRWKKKILPGHRVSGVSWRDYVDVPVLAGAVNDVG